MKQRGIYQPRYYDRNKIAFVMCSTGEKVSFGELEDRANQGAHLIRSLGVGTEDHIAILMENRREFMEICFAADRCGVYYTTISTHFKHAEIAYILRDCSAKILIVSEKFRFLCAETQIPEDCKILYVSAKHETNSWDFALSCMPTEPIEDEAQGLDMLYSSGTTGRPKGIKWPLPNTVCGEKTMLIELLSALFHYGPDTRYLSPAPLYHAAPLRHSMVTIKMGGVAYIMERFDPIEALKCIERYQITHSQWVPTMFVRMLKLPELERKEFDLSSMKVAIHAAAPCPIDIKLKMIEWWGKIIYEYYAGTENNGFTSLDTNEWLEHQGSVGSAKLGVIHICDENGNELPPYKPGEIFFENGHQFAYHNDPQKTAECTNDHGWTTLGDIGYVDEEGYLYLTDRKSFVIISGGVNVYPQETEDVLITHPHVLDAAVFGVPNSDLGEEVKAVIQLVPHVVPTNDIAVELLDYCRNRLSSIKVPKSISFQEQLPRTPTGKLFKKELISRYR